RWGASRSRVPRRRTDPRKSPGRRRPAEPPKPSGRWKKVLLALLALGVASALAWLSRGPFERYRTGRQFARAQEILGASQDDAGAAELRSVLERDAAHPAARLALARLELKRGRIEHAFLHFEAFSELVPLDPEGWLGLAEV